MAAARFLAYRPHAMRFPLFPDSRAGSYVYMTAATLCMLGALASAWGQHRTEKAMADHGEVADVLPVTGVVQHASTTRFSGSKFNEWKSAQLTFRTAAGQTLTITHGLGEEELQALQGGGTLHMQYLPEDPQQSARLEGHPKKPWEALALAGFLALYAMALKPPSARAARRTGRMQGRR